MQKFYFSDRFHLLHPYFLIFNYFILVQEELKKYEGLKSYGDVFTFISSTPSINNSADFAIAMTLLILASPFPPHV